MRNAHRAAPAHLIKGPGESSAPHRGVPFQVPDAVSGLCAPTTVPSCAGSKERRPSAQNLARRLAQKTCVRSPSEARSARLVLVMPAEGGLSRCLPCIGNRATILLLEKGLKEGQHRCDRA